MVRKGVPMAQDAFAGPNDRRKRREARHPASDVAGTVGGQAIRVVNVSPSGVGLQSDQPLRVGKVYPVALSGRDLKVELPSTARWCQMTVKRNGSDSETVFGVGLRFEGASGEEVRRLEAVVGLPMTTPEKE